MAKPVDWIGPLIEVELAAVIAWWKNTEAPHAINKTESRFEDDGSNFRSTVQASTLPVKTLAQISEVVRGNVPGIIVITDGYTQIKAKLSDSAIQVFESEIDEKINPETKGDVILIKETIIASTPYGPQDERIQFEIQDIDYMYHLRKSLGRKQTILERAEAARLLNEITDIRSRQYDIPGIEPEPEPTYANVDTSTGALRDSDESQGNEIRSPQSQQSTSPSHRSQLAKSQPSFATQAAIATQVSQNRRKRKTPSMEEDGLEISQGVNLARPHGPGFSSPTSRSWPSKRQQLGDDKTRSAMLSLLANKSKDGSLKTSPTAAEKPPTQTKPQSASPTAPPKVPDISGEVEQMSIAGSEEASAPVVEQLPAANKIHSDPVSRKYSRRRIPLDQRNLLEKPDSWLPPLPGKQFPRPNVPIQLLKKSHTQAHLVKEKVAQAEPTTIAERMIMEPTASTSESSSDSSDDEVLPWSQSPSQMRPQRPPDSTIGSDNHTSPLSGRTHVRPGSSHSALSGVEQLTPDSSKASSKHSSRATKQTQRSSVCAHISPPKSKQQLAPRNSIDSDIGSDKHTSPKKQRPQLQPGSSQLALQKKGPLLFDSSQGISKAPSSGAKQTQQPPVGSNTSSKTKGQLLQTDTAQSSGGGGGSKRFVSEDRDAVAFFQSISANKKQPRGPSRNPSVERTPQPKVLAHRTPEKSNHFQRPSTSNSIVKGTQLQDNDDMELEMSVPRSLHHVKEQNPSSIEHRKYRSAHMKAIQRQHWLQSKHDYDSTASSLSFNTIRDIYKAKHPNDESVRLSEFREALEVSFPELYPDGSNRAVGGLKSKGAKDPHVRAPPQDGDVLMEDADAPSVGAATNLQGVSAQPAVVDLTLDEMQPGMAKVDRTARVAEQKRRQKNDDVTNPAGEKLRYSPWGEFESAMKNVQPGGAFADGNGGLSGVDRNTRQRLNVLDWDV